MTVIKPNATYGAGGNRRRRNCRVISDTAAHVKKPIARRQVEIVEASQQECRLAVVEVPASVQSDEHVVVEVPRVVVWRELLAAHGLGQS